MLLIWPVFYDFFPFKLRLLTCIIMVFLIWVRNIYWLKYQKKKTSQVAQAKVILLLGKTYEFFEILAVFPPNFKKNCTFVVKLLLST